MPFSEYQGLGGRLGGERPVAGAAASIPQSRSGLVLLPWRRLGGIVRPRVVGPADAVERAVELLIRAAGSGLRVACRIAPAALPRHNVRRDGPLPVRGDLVDVAVERPLVAALAPGAACEAVPVAVGVLEAGADRAEPVELAAGGAAGVVVAATVAEREGGA